MAITGIVYLVMPDCVRSRLAMLHFWGHNAGLPVMMGSLVLMAYGEGKAEPALAASSTLVLVALLFFAINVLRNGRPDRVRDDAHEPRFQMQVPSKHSKYGSDE